MVSGSFCVNIAQGSHLCNVGPWQTGNFYEKNNLCNVVSTMLGQHFIGYCLPNVVQTRLRQHYTRKLLVQGWPRAHKHVFAGK